MGAVETSSMRGENKFRPHAQLGDLDGKEKEAKSVDEELEHKHVRLVRKANSWVDANQREAQERNQ